jgi:endonuclease-3
MKKMQEKRIDQIISTLRRAVKDLKEPSVTMVGKKWKSPFFVLISCVLSLRTRDQVTLPASERLFKLADTPEKILTLSTKTIEKVIYPVGFYKTKARNIKSICRDIIYRFEGRIPDHMEGLLSLKGVGRKTANLVLTEGFGKLGICVDTHVHRISNRLGYVKTTTPEETEWALREKLPQRYWIEFNTLLVMWGQNICKPISPLCSQCPLFIFCQRVGIKKYR